MPLSLAICQKLGLAQNKTKPAQKEVTIARYLVDKTLFDIFLWNEDKTVINNNATKAPPKDNGNAVNIVMG